MPSLGLSPEYPSPRLACLAAASMRLPNLVRSHAEDRLVVTRAPADEQSSFIVSALTSR